MSGRTRRRCSQSRATSQDTGGCTPPIYDPDPGDYLPDEFDFYEHHGAGQSYAERICSALSILTQLFIIAAMLVQIYYTIYKDHDHFGKSNHSEPLDSPPQKPFKPAVIPPNPDKLCDSEPTFVPPKTDKIYESEPTFVPPKSEKFCDFPMEEDHTSELIELHRQIDTLNVGLEVLKAALVNVTNWRSNIESKVEELEELEKETKQLASEPNCQVDEKIDRALQLYDADKTGKMDFALESAGGTVVATPLTVPYPSKISYEAFGMLTMHYPSNPRVMIQSSSLPGECFAFHGSQGKIRLKLAQNIHVDSVSLEHTSIAVDKTSAPRSFAVLGLKNEFAELGENLGRFVYILDSKPIQSFELEKDRTVKCYQFLELNILSNYGHKQYTCLYRFRVHGRPCDNTGTSLDTY